jgi:hypothetical protein
LCLNDLKAQDWEETMTTDNDIYEWVEGMEVCVINGIMRTYSFGVVKKVNATTVLVRGENDKDLLFTRRDGLGKEENGLVGFAIRPITREG